MTKRRRLLIILLCLFFAILGAAFLVPAFSARAAETSFVKPKTLAELRKADPADIASLSSYNSRDYSIVSTVKNQGGYNLCWSYATVAASETSILREGVGNAVQSAFFNFDERNLAWWSHNPRADEFGLIAEDVPEGSGKWNLGGYPEVAGKALLQWMGPVKQLPDSEYYAEDDDEDAIRAVYPAAYKLESLIPVSYTVENVKRAVAEYGAVEFCFPIHMLSTGGYTIDTYFNNKEQPRSNPHACAIVGWDDSIPASKFRPTVSSGDGGWIVKNSWGTGYHDGGYFYLSYDSYIYDIYAYDYTTADAFDHQYLYNGSISGGAYNINADGKGAAIFRAQGGTAETYEAVNAVNIGVTGKNIGVNVTVYKGLSPNYGNPRAAENDPEAGVPVASGSATFAGKGYYTVYLDKKVPLENGESFSVVVELSGDNAALLGSLDVSSNDMTFLYKNDKWSNVRTSGAYCAHIRAYTEDVAREAPVSANDLRFARIRLLQQSFDYCGEKISPSAVVTLGERTLVEGEDYELRYEENLFALQNARVIATGKGEYSGECTAYFTVKQVEYPFNRPVMDRNVPIVVGSEITHLGQIELPAGWRWYYDVDLTKFDSDIPMEWTIVYEGEDAFCFTKTQTGVYVTRESKRHDLISIEGAEAVQTGRCVYTGEAVKPTFSVTADGVPLTEGVHYTVRAEAVDAGTAYAELTGMGDYTGTLRVPYTIERAEQPAFRWETELVERGEEINSLFDLELPENWEWTEDIPLAAGEMHATARYVGADASNYKTLTREVVFTVAEPDPQPEPQPQPEPDTGETEQPDTGETEQPDTGETEQPDGGETEQPDGGETEEPDTGETEQPDGGGGEEPKRGIGCANAVFGAPLLLFLLAGIFMRRKR